MLSIEQLHGILSAVVSRHPRPISIRLRDGRTHGESILHRDIPSRDLFRGARLLITRQKI